MSFFNLGYSLTNINTILEREHFTLEDLLDEQDVVQECSKDNKQLVEFLAQPNVLLRMLEFAIGAPDENADEAVRYKYPSVATDILSVGVYGICQGLVSNEKVWDGKTLMQRLWNFLDNPAPLNPLLASYFSKIAGGLLQKKSNEVLAFVREDKTILDKLLLNMGTSAVMELLTSIFGDRDLKHTDGVMEWLTEEKLVMRLVENVSMSSSSDMQDNASQALVEVVGLNKLTIEYLGPDPIVMQLYDREIMEKLAQQLIVPKASPTLISNGIDVFLSLMNAGQLPITGEEQVQQLSEQSLLRLSLQSAEVGRVLSPHVGAFAHILKNGAPSRTFLTTFGELNPPLGTHRLRVAELFMSMVGNPKLVDACKDALISCKVAEAMFDHFFHYKWNNMLHSTVERYVISVLEYASMGADASALVKATLLDSNFLARLLITTRENRDRGMGARDGYMGSVFVLINSINAFFTRHDQPAYVTDLAREYLTQEWKDYIQYELPLVNEKNERPLGGHRPNNNTDEEDDFDVGGDCSGDINQDLAYMRFLSQQISSAPSNDDFLSSSSEEDSDVSDEVSDEDDGDRIFRPALEDAFAPDAAGAQQLDDTNEAIAAAFGRTSINDGGEIDPDLPFKDPFAVDTKDPFANDKVEDSFSKDPFGDGKSEMTDIDAQTVGEDKEVDEDHEAEVPMQEVTQEAINQTEEQSVKMQEVTQEAINQTEEQSVKMQEDSGPVDDASAHKDTVVEAAMDEDEVAVATSGPAEETNESNESMQTDGNVEHSTPSVPEDTN